MCHLHFFSTLFLYFVLFCISPVLAIANVFSQTGKRVRADEGNHRQSQTELWYSNWRYYSFRLFIIENKNEKEKKKHQITDGATIKCETTREKHVKSWNQNKNYAKTTSTTVLWCIHFSIIDCMTSSANFQVKVHEKLSCLRRSVPGVCVCVCAKESDVCACQICHTVSVSVAFMTHFHFGTHKIKFIFFSTNFFVGLVFISNDIMFPVLVSLWAQCTHAYNRRGFQTIERMHIMHTHSHRREKRNEKKKLLATPTKAVTIETSEKEREREQQRKYKKKTKNW